MLEPENAKMYIDDQFAFSAVKGVEQENETVAGVKEDIASWQRLQTSQITTIHPDLICPHFLTEMCLNYTNGMDNRGEHKSVPCNSAMRNMTLQM